MATAKGLSLGREAGRQAGGPGVGEGEGRISAETWLSSGGELLPWTEGLGRGEAGMEEMVYSLEGAWGAPSRAPTPSILPRQECNSSFPPCRAH